MYDQEEVERSVYPAARGWDGAQVSPLVYGCSACTRPDARGATGAFDLATDAQILCLWPQIPYVSSLYISNGWPVGTTAQKRAVLNNYWLMPECADRLHYGTVSNLMVAANCGAVAACQPPAGGCPTDGHWDLSRCECVGGGPQPPGGSNTMLILGVAGIAAITVVAVAMTQASKKTKVLVPLGQAGGAVRAAASWPNKSEKRNVDFDSSYQLYIDSQEVRGILDGVKLPPGFKKSDVTGVMVWSGHGYYRDVWVTESSQPYSAYAAYEQAKVL